jgi:cell division inhibitor SepF
MSAWKKAMNYLGLGPDDAYDDYDQQPPMPVDPAARAPRPMYEPELDSGTVRTVPPRSVPREPAPARAPMGQPEYGGEPPAITIRSRQASAVRTVAASSSTKPHTVRPRRFDQAQEVADKFKEGQPVIVNLQDVDRDLSRRLIDFASGLCYGLGGTMEKVASGVYLLTPANVSMSAEEKRAISERGLDD